MTYALYGDPLGTPLLAVHGTPGAGIMMQPADRFALDNGICLIAPDRPGYGFSSACPNYSFEQWVQDIEALMEALTLDQFWLFGVSGGGPFAVALAALMPQRVLGMALVSPVGLIDEEVGESWSWRSSMIFSMLPRHPLLMKSLFTIARTFLLSGPSLVLQIFAFSLSKSDQMILTNPIHKEALIKAFREGLRVGIEGVLGDMRLFASPWRLPLQKITMPVILWQGSHDLMVPAKASAKLAHHLSDVEFNSLQRQGHFWILEHFEEVLNRLLTLSRNEDETR